MVYGYLRVSSDKQDYNNQKMGVDDLAKRNGWVIDKYVLDDGVSGTIEAKKRNLGKQLLPRLREGDIIICSELSRLGRKLLMVMTLLKYIMERKAIVYTVKDNFVLGDNIQSMVLAFAFGLAAQIERDMISQRTKEALALRRAQGVILGRPKGRHSRDEKRKLYKDLPLIQQLLDKRVSKRKIARIVKCDRNTLDRHIKDFGLRTYPNFARGRKVMDTRTGIVYNKLIEAAEKTGISINTMAAQLRKGTGFFVYFDEYEDELTTNSTIEENESVD